jgi:hypothetical protein
LAIAVDETIASRVSDLFDPHEEAEHRVESSMRGVNVGETIVVPRNPVPSLSLLELLRQLRMRGLSFSFE